MSLLPAFATLPILIAVASPGDASPQPQVAPQEFVASVSQYAEIHRLVTAPFGQPQTCSDAEELLRREWALARAVREVRPHAREGDIFTPEAARYFRALIAEVTWKQGLDLMREVEDAVGWDAEAAAVEVNTPLPWNAGPMMWPSVLSQLPALPPELEYRFVGRDLVLVDTAGSIVVDVLREALPTAGGSVSG